MMKVSSEVLEIHHAMKHKSLPCDTHEHVFHELIHPKNNFVKIYEIVELWSISGGLGIFQNAR